MADSEEAKVSEEQPVAQEKVEADEKQETEPVVEAPTKTDPDETPSETNNGEGETTENGQKVPDAAAGGDAKEEAEAEAEAKAEAEAEAEDEDDEDDRKLFVGGLSWETQQNGLKDFMIQFGEVESCIIKKDNTTGRSRGFGFVVFKEVAGLEKALEGRPHKVDGRKIDSKKAQPQPKREIKLFVGGVKPETDEETIKKYFSEFGEVVKIDRPKEGGRDGKKFKAFCFVTFKKDSTVAKVTKTRHHTLDDKEVECKEADPPQNAQGGSRGRGRGGGGRGFPFMGGPGPFRYGHGGFPPGPYGYDMGAYGFNPGFGMPYGGGGFGGGGGYGYGQQQHSGHGKSRGGRHQNSFKPY